MRTRIKKTTAMIDGVQQVSYRAEVFVWQDELAWYPAGRKLIWQAPEYDHYDVNWTELFGEEGSLERAKKIIDTLLAVVAKKKADRLAEKAIKDSIRTEVIPYP